MQIKNRNLYIYMSKHFYSDNKSIQKISSYLDHIYGAPAPLATWWPACPLSAFSVIPSNGHLAVA